MSYTRLKTHHFIRHKIERIKSSEYLKILILRTIGNFLIISSLFMIVKTFYLPVREEIRFYLDKIVQKQYYLSDVRINSIKPAIEPQIRDSQPKGLLAKALNIEAVEYLIPEDPNFSIVVPKIAANAKIISNVDPSNDKIYLEALNKGVAHSLGTAFPGEGGHVFLFAHSTDYFWNVGTYNAIFYLLSKLEKSDEINLFYKKQRYVYKVISKIIVNPSQVEYLTRKTNKEFLTLQTCWPPGTTLKRLLVFARRVAE